MRCSQLFRGLTISLVAMACVSAIARDHDHDRDRDNVWHPTEDHALWRNECGTCHMAFPPGLLASEDWLDLMAQLDKHFGVDASLDPSANADIAAYLKQKGGHHDDFGGRGEELPRITNTAKFTKKHRSAIRLWSKGQVKSLSDCGACHKDAVTQR